MPFESAHNVENQEEPQVHVLLHFMRHAEKASDNRVADEEDVDVRLTDKGRKQAAQKGEGRVAHTSRPTAVGSPRKRTQETGAWAIAGGDPRLAGGEAFEEILAMPDEQGIPYGSRVWENRLLDVPFVKGTPIHEALTTAYDEGHYLRTLLQYHRETQSGSREALDAYVVQAANITRIIQRWVNLTQKFGQRLAYHEGDVPENEKTIERLMATHGGVAESALAEIVRRTRGEAELEAFLQALPNGLSLAEGFDVEIVSSSTTQEPEVRVHGTFGSGDSTYALDVVVPFEVINGIVRDFSTPRAQI